MLVDAFETTSREISREGISQILTSISSLIVVIGKTCATHIQKIYIQGFDNRISASIITSLYVIAIMSLFQIIY